MRAVPLPHIMVAPNGARRTQHDHIAIPITDDELVKVAVDCFAAGADGIHAHIRDAEQRHLIDAERYRDLIARLNDAVPDMYVQVTSEAAGRYDAATQQAVVRALRPQHVSVGMREMVRKTDDWIAAQNFYAWAADEGVGIQHIVYSLAELDTFINAAEAGKIPGQDHQMQLVLGTYDGTQISQSGQIKAFCDRMDQSEHTFDWMLCAFGKEETACLVETHRLGGKVRIGFENSLWHADGTIAKDNPDRIRAFLAARDL